MALLDHFGFEASTNKAHFYDTIGGSYSISSSLGRFGGSCLVHDNAGGFSGGTSALRTIPTSNDTVYFGFAFRWEYVQSGQNNAIFYLRDGGTAQVALHMTDAGVFTVCAGSGTTNYFGANTVTLTAGTWYHIGGKVVLHPSAGTFDLYIDQTHITAMSGTGLVTQTSGNARVTGIGHDASWFSATSTRYLYDDIYVNDSSGSTCNSWMGDLRSVLTLSNAAGTYAQFTKGGTPAATNYQGVNEASPDSDTTYNYSVTPGQHDAFNYTDVTLSGNAQIKAVSPRAFARRDDVGTVELKGFARVGGADYTTTRITALTDTYRYFTLPFELNPATGLAWTQAGINGAEFGYETA